MLGEEVEREILKVLDMLSDIQKQVAEKLHQSKKLSLTSKDRKIYTSTR